MRLLPTLLLTLLGTAASAAKPKKTPQERFSLYHTKSLAAAPRKLSDPAYRALTGAPRDYSVAVLLTAMDSRYGCQLCREFQPEWDLLARSWTAGDKKGESRIVFGTLDFSDGRDVFMSVRIPTYLAAV
jgi:oligosaccharyltransferase complex subunit gamma